MKGIALALALTAPPDARSLGVGIDVLPEAFTYAAGKVGFVPDLRLQRCDSAQCRWTIKGTIVLAASFLERNLEVYKIEAVSAPGPQAARATPGFEETCRSIVELLQPDASPSERQLLAREMAGLAPQAGTIDAQRDDFGVTFYGEAATLSRGDRPVAGARCGASVDAPNQP